MYVCACVCVLCISLVGNEAGNWFFLGGTVGNVEMELLAWAANEYIRVLCVVLLFALLFMKCI